MSDILTPPAAIQQILQAKFDLTEIQLDEAEPGRFQGRFIEPVTLLRRILKFSSSIKVLDIKVDPAVGVAYATVALSFFYWVKSPAETWHLHEDRKDGVGSFRLKADQSGRYVDVDFAVKSAVTDAIKIAAKHHGIALELWDRSTAPVAPKHPTTYSPAQPFQIKQICDFFDVTCNWPREYWLGQLGVKAPEEISLDLATALLDGTHPFAIFASQNVGKNINSGLRTSAAR